MSRTDRDWSAAEAAEIARLNAELASLVQDTTEAQTFLGELGAALFPEGPPSLGQVTWPDKPASRAVTGAEDRLRAAEIRYRTLVEQIPAVTFLAVLGEGENEVYVSPHIETLLGFTQQEWLENPFLWYSQLHPDDRELWNAEFARGCRTGGPFRAECRFLTRDGRVVWVRGEARVVRDEAGRPLFLQGVAFDITDGKRAEALLLREAVRSTEERYRDLVEGLGAVVWEAEPRLFHFTLVSRHAEELLGFPPERWIDDRDFWPDHIHPDDLDEVIGTWRNAIQQGDDHAFEYRVFAADGRVVWLQDNMRVRRDAEGRAQHILGMMLDVTTRKRAEEERAQLLVREREARAESETLNRVERLLAAELDFPRLVQTVTDAGRELCGATFGAFFGNVKDASGESCVLHALSGVWRDAFADFLQPGNTPLFASTSRGAGAVRCDDVTKDPRHGTMSPCRGLRSYLAVPVVSRSAEVLGGLFFGHPEAGWFTERHERMLGGLAAQAAVAMDNARLFETAEIARREAETANRAKDEFLATMSHELRTPLTAVLGWVRMLRTGPLDAGMRARALETIERNAQTQAQLIEDVLDVSRIITGKLRLDVQALDLNDVVTAACEVVGFAAQAKSVSLEIALDASVGPIMGDGQRLQQVVWNLLSNAIKFTPSGGRVMIGLERGDRLARIVVRDTGAGISSDFLPHVFDRFRQADGSSTRRHGGLGLGLAIVRHIVEQHGGTVRAESAGAGRGTTFVVELPVTPSPVGSDQGSVSEAAAHQPLRGTTVLVVDDQADARDLLQMILQHAGADVVVAPSAAVALAMIAQVSPAVIVSDIGMPGDDGYAFVAELRERGVTVPAVAVTAYGRNEDRERALRAGFQLYVRKPIDSTVLVDAVTALLDDSPRVA